MKNLILKRPNESSFVTYVKKRITNNLNFLGIFTGSPGIGKTYNALSFACKIDPSFDVKTQVAFDFKQCMDIINNPEFRKKKIKIIIWDEPQISLSNRAWQSEANRLINFLLSTFRHQNIIMLFAAPYKDFLDSQAMRLLHCEFICEGWNKKTHLSRVRPKLLQYNSALKKYYYHRLYVINEDGRITPLDFWDIDKPSREVIVVYEELKSNFTSKLNKEIISKLDNYNTEDKKQEPVRKPLTEKQLKVMQTLAHHKFEEASEILNLSLSTIHKHKSLAEAKGYKLEEFK